MDYDQIISRSLLIKFVGVEKATLLLPSPFRIRSYQLGDRFSILIREEKEGRNVDIDVWMGSYNRSAVNKEHGLQPEFEFAREFIDGFFAKLQSIADRQNEEKERNEKERRLSELTEQQQLLEKAKAVIYKWWE